MTPPAVPIPTWRSRCRIGLIAGALVVEAVSCGRPASPAAVRPGLAPPASATMLPAPRSAAAPRATSTAPPPAALTPTLPPHVEVGARAIVPVPGDQDVIVYSGPAERRRPFVYLHGVCGDPSAVEAWVHVVTLRGTLVVLRGESPCPDRPGRSSWKAPAATLAERIDRALTAVRAHRGGLLDPEDVVLIGYSQGAARAEQLARLRPGSFRRLVLASGPKPPDPAALAATAAVAVLAGSEEHQEPLQAGVAALCAAGLRARYFTLPGAAHGEYGRDGARVIDEALAWLLEEPAADGG